MRVGGSPEALLLSVCESSVVSYFYCPFYRLSLHVCILVSRGPSSSPYKAKEQAPGKKVSSSSCNLLT